MTSVVWFVAMGQRQYFGRRVNFHAFNGSKPPWEQKALGNIAMNRAYFPNVGYANCRNDRGATVIRHFVPAGG